MDPFYVCPEEELDFMIDRLIERVGQLSDNDIAFEILKVVAMTLSFPCRISSIS